MRRNGVSVPPSKVIQRKEEISMKKISILVVCIALCISLCSCGKSESAINVDNLILDIGEVTLESGNKITAAEKAVGELKESEYRQLEHLNILEEAKSTYDELVVAEIESAIDGIGIVTLEKEAIITSIRTQYNNASDQAKDEISNYETLKQAEKELSNLKVQNVINLIDQIGKVSLSSGEKIDIANAAYNLLSPTEKEQVTNYSVIEAASKNLTELQEAEKERALQQALSSLQSETDKVEGITWYKPSTYPSYVNTRCYVLPYIGRSDYSTWLRLRFNYTGDDWIFFEKITISIDGENYYKTYNYFDVDRDNGSGDVWEWVDISVTDSDIEMLKQIVSSNETIVRFQGEKYYYDFTIQNSDKTAINQVLTAYEALQNN